MDIERRASILLPILESSYIKLLKLHEKDPDDLNRHQIEINNICRKIKIILDIKENSLVSSFVINSAYKKYTEEKEEKNSNTIQYTYLPSSPLKNYFTI